MALIFPQGASIVPLFEKLDTQGNFNSLPFSANSLRGWNQKQLVVVFSKKGAYLLASSLLGTQKARGYSKLAKSWTINVWVRVVKGFCQDTNMF